MLDAIAAAADPHGRKAKRRNPTPDAIAATADPHGRKAERRNPTLDAIAATADPSGDARVPIDQAMDGFLANFARQNPDLAWLTQMIAMQRQAAATRPDEPAINGAQIEIDALSQRLQQSEARADKLQRVVDQLTTELGAAQDMLADLAAALGACGLCWGQDAQCRCCRGRGKPGSFSPDVALQSRFFAEPIQPARKPAQPFTAPEQSERR